MSVEIQWTDTDPDSGEKRFVRVERFAGKWEFAVRAKRRENWAAPSVISREMWEVLLEAIERRYTRREGITDADLHSVRQILGNHRDPPTAKPVNAE
jgi:hypothetical protein